jgi:Ca2+-dependent lipid-binding protein
MGNLTVALVRARNLIAADRGGHSDPYVKFELNDEGVHKSEVVKKTVNPEFENETFIVPIVCAAIQISSSNKWHHRDPSLFLAY